MPASWCTREPTASGPGVKSSAFAPFAIHSPSRAGSNMTAATSSGAAWMVFSTKNSMVLGSSNKRASFSHSARGRLDEAQGRRCSRTVMLMSHDAPASRLRRLDPSPVVVQMVVHEQVEVPSEAAGGDQRHVLGVQPEAAPFARRMMQSAIDRHLLRLEPLGHLAEPFRPAAEHGPQRREAPTVVRAVA